LTDTKHVGIAANFASYQILLKETSIPKGWLTEAQAAGLCE